jgi:DNA polymerase-4
VERFGVDESFLDLTGCLRNFGDDGVKAAHEIRERVHREIGITISVGVSWNKIFSKLGSDYKKPNAVTVINRENWRDIVLPLPAGDLFFVGRKTVEALSRLNVFTIGDLAAQSRERLVDEFGKHGETLYKNANGLDDSPVTETGAGEPVKSVGNGYTFKRDLVSESDVHTGVIYLADSVASRLRKHNVKCRVVAVTIKDTALKSFSRQMTLSAPTYLAGEIVEAALELIAKNWSKGKPIRMLTITAENLVPPDYVEAAQLSLFDIADGQTNPPKNERRERLEKTLDEIRGRYGKHSVQSAAIVKNDLGIRESDSE